MITPPRSTDILPLQVRDLHRERAALERDYATKMQLLVKKAAEKKAKKMPALVVGNEPTKAWDENTIRQRFAVQLIIIRSC